MNWEQLQKDVEASTPGPWAWHGTPGELKLATVNRGKIYVMGFERKGMNGAEPTFQVRGKGMKRASALCKFVVGDPDVTGETDAKSDESVYRYDVRGIDHPDAHLIALAPDLATLALAGKRLADAVQHEREMVCQDMGKQMELARATDAALTAFRAAEGESHE